MIVLDLICEQGHRFDGWFSSADAFRDQCGRHLVQCPCCQTSGVTQLPSAPHVRRAAQPSGTAVPESANEVAVQFHQVLARLARTAENVGERFPEEARRIHYDEAPARSIRGVTSLREAAELIEEGIAILPVPTVPDEELH